jgi:hypothetical protein
MTLPKAIAELEEAIETALDSNCTWSEETSEIKNKAQALLQSLKSAEKATGQKE